MAVIDATYPESISGKRGTVLWETLTCGDTGEWIETKDFNDNTISVAGTFNSQTITIQGANADDKSDAFTLVTVPLGLAATFTAAGGRLLAEPPTYIRPSFSGDSGGDVDVYLKLRKS